MRSAPHLIDPSRVLRRVSVAACAIAAAMALVPDRLAAQASPSNPVYKVGVLTDNPPFSYAEGGEPPKGFAVDLLAAVEEAMGLRLERVVGPTNVINARFESGELDMLQSLAPTDERRRFTRFSRPYLEMNGSIFVRRGTRDVEQLTDLAGRRVMVHEGSLGERALREAGLAGSIVHVNSVEEGLRLLDTGQYDATLAARLTGQSVAARLGLHNIIAVGPPIPGYRVDYCFAVRIEHAGLASQVDEALMLLDRPDGSGLIRRQQIYDTWFSHLGPRRYSALDIAIAVSVGLGLAVIVMFWAAMHQRRLRHQVAQKAAELRASEEGYRAVFESTAHGLIVFEKPSAAPEGWRVHQINPAARRILGEPAAEGTPASFAANYPAEGTLGARLLPVLDAPDPQPFEHDRSTAQHPAWVHVSITRLGDRRRLVSLRDITEARVAAERLRLSEAQVRQNQKLEAIGTLASGIAHDFNNVLTAIVGNAEVMRLDLPSDHFMLPALQEIREAAERARFLVRQILTFSRRSESHRQVIQATPIVKETLRFVSATAPSSIEFRHHVDAQSPAIEIDPTHLHQVLMNLATNAVHAMRGRTGIIEISEQTVAIEPGQISHPADLSPGDYLRIAVRDTGEGMSPEVLQRIFEPFFTTKPAGEGTGLGLAVVHGIVHGCGGTVSVASTRGVGTTFRLYFPASTRAAAPGAVEGSGIPPGHGERILFVDDEPAIVHAAGRLLERLGYEVVAFSQPHAALEEFRRRAADFSVVVTDLTMPRMSGIELASHVRLIAPDLPVILTSGFINDREAAHARAERITRILEKPLSLEVLGAAVAECMLQRH